MIFYHQRLDLWRLHNLKFDSSNFCNIVRKNANIYLSLFFIWKNKEKHIAMIKK